MHTNYLGLLMASVVSTASATSVAQPDQDLIVDGRRGVIVGRGLFFRNEKLILVDDSNDIFKASVDFKITSFEKLADQPILKRSNIYSLIGKSTTKTWAVSAKSHKDGYFAISLAPGKYF
jgi:hypothetical protein